MIHGPIGDGLKLLIECLEAEVWTPEEAKFLLANQKRDFIELIDPPGPWARIIPLRHIPKEREEKLYEEDTAVLIHAEQLTNGHSAMAPVDWINLALESGVEPPWLSVIRTLPIAKKIGMSEFLPPPSSNKRSNPDSPEARGGHEKRKNSVTGLVEDEIRRDFNKWKANPGEWTEYRVFLRGMIKKYIDPYAFDTVDNYSEGKLPAVRDRRTITKIVDKLTHNAGPPFEKPRKKSSV